MNKILLALRELIPTVVGVDEVTAIGGGCISEARRVAVTLDDGLATTWFVKSNAASFLSNFQAEWDGLSRLAAADAITVPRPLAVGVAQGAAWLVMQWIESSASSPRLGERFFQDFGRGLAQLHRATLGHAIGLPQDNYLGWATQINTPCDDWGEFVANHRIGFQLRWAVDQGLADGKLRRDGEQIIASMDRCLEGRDRSTSLLHGDLWSGNYLCDQYQKPVLIDPAVYHGCREAEFGMLKLFGSCPPSFYEAYHDHFPLLPGWQRRTSVYVLYHLLNHLNLFGSGYLGQCRSIAAEILGA